MFIGDVAAYRVYVYMLYLSLAGKWVNSTF